ncbi:receptor-transporting protein 4 [Tupaia chinensis]|uniref:Receptor-transporting protein 4 n=1 Tax=Tupaia chinensis TaxID=246437 RepID=L9JKC9_TUPCH|nr:receptor-transporting protein 4 [Tupaia chinensis]ELW50920.1 Receptor-transporting protein 4 [Tupaia chinensis]
MTLDIRTWEKTFQKLIQQEKPSAKWTLRLDGNLKPDYVSPGWRQYQQRAFGRFRCSSCQRSWASAQVQVLCHMCWDHWTSQGLVLMRLFAQRCQKCSWSPYQMPEFSTDSSTRILKNLVHRILEKYYGYGVKKYAEIPVVQELPLEGSHDIVNCEACALGFCAKGLQDYIPEPCQSLLSFPNTDSPSSLIGNVYVQNQENNQSAETERAPENQQNYEHNGSVPSHNREKLVICVCVFLFAYFVTKGFKLKW